MRKLIVLCGPSRCGKSTFAANLFTTGNYVVINSDVIRLHITGSSEPGEMEDAVWELFEKYKMDALKSGKNVILDACHMTSQARWHSLQGVPLDYERICILFNVKLKTILMRSEESWVKQMWRAFRCMKLSKRVLLKEGYDKVEVIKG